VFFIFRVRFVILAAVLFFSLLLFSRQPAGAEPGIVINKGTNQLAFFVDGYLLDVFPVATGRLPQFTPEGKWRVVRKLIYPAWRHPRGGPLIPGGVPENPLGPRWLGLDALGTAGGSYGVHGNNNPGSIGSHASLGCVRMHNRDILWLYDRAPLGMEVEIINSGEDLAGWKKIARVTVNGAEPEFAPHLGPVQAGETSYLPVRPTATALGYRLSWQDPAGTILLANIDREVLLTLDSGTVTVNNNVYTAGEAPIFLEGITFAPDYYFQSYLGVEAHYDHISRTLAMTAPVDPSGGRLVRYNLTVQVDGKALHLPEDLAPLNDGENLLVPARPFCAVLGAVARWHEELKAVEITTRGKTLTIPAGGAPARLNGAVVDIPSGIFFRNGYAYVNLRLLTGAFGFPAELDDSSRTLRISTFNIAEMFFNPFRQAKSPGTGPVSTVFFYRRQ